MSRPQTLSVAPSILDLTDRLETLQQTPVLLVGKPCCQLALSAQLVLAAIVWTCSSSFSLFLVDSILLGGESPYLKYVLLVFPFCADLEPQSTSFPIRGHYRQARL